MTLADPRIRDQQIQLARLGDRSLDRAAIRDVDLHPLAACFTRDRLDLRAARAPTTTSQPSPASARAMPAPIPTTATRNERSHRMHPTAPRATGVHDEERESAKRTAALAQEAFAYAAISSFDHGAVRRSRRPMTVFALPMPSC